MANSRLVVSVHRIITSDPSAPTKVDGYDDRGEPILRKEQIAIEPNTLWDAPAYVDLEDLWKLGAIREPTESEKALGKAIDQGAAAWAERDVGGRERDSSDRFRGGRG